MDCGKVRLSFVILIGTMDINKTKPQPSDHTMDHLDHCLAATSSSTDFDDPDYDHKHYDHKDTKDIDDSPIICIIQH